MKTCPYCREQVHDEAIKCRFCASELQKLSAAAAEPHAAAAEPHKESSARKQVVYVLDEDLIRFAKFTGSTLVLFATVGAFLWGFDVKHTSDEVKKTAEEVTKVKDDTQKMVGELRQSKVELDKARNELVMANNQAEQLLESLKEKKEKADEIESQLERRQAIVQQSGVASEIDAGLALSQSTWFTVPQIAKLYDFPPDLDGQGQTIGIIELGGGYQSSDLSAYFAKLGLKRPEVTWVSVDGAGNQSTNGPADEQVTMDVEIAGSVAPRARIVVYFSKNSGMGFVDAVSKAVNDDKNHPSIISIAWGQPESSWTAGQINALNDVLKAAAAKGITVLAAAGDQGATDGVTDGRPHVDFPASSPWVLACGGTRLTVLQGRIESEVVWNDEQGAGEAGLGLTATGGGVSAIFSRPDWQAGVSVPLLPSGRPGRGIPDVSANASPNTGYQLYVRGRSSVVGGTSAVAPLWAGLTALLNQGLGHPVGYLNPVLYRKVGPQGVLREITQGDNGVGAVKGYSAAKSWNAATGWGSPNGRRLLEALRAAQ